MRTTSNRPAQSPASPGAAAAGASVLAEPSSWQTSRLLLGLSGASILRASCGRGQTRTPLEHRCDQLRGEQRGNRFKTRA